MILDWNFFCATDAIVDCENEELRLTEILSVDAESSKTDCSLFVVSDYFLHPVQSSKYVRMIDYLTRFIVTKALPTAEATQVTKDEEIILQHSASEEI
ncbi:hypothetical protein CEXT_399841 [Caerostris extrusa]|uniref:Uncharacterized protein n=1 Tax=Caerostris extrusa TaxID=172846 RepID=A0AAV4TKJ3_CAEEX|nr:hypothetical protein CEXT_399841 [Caerostris extrusa]